MKFLALKEAIEKVIGNVQLQPAKSDPDPPKLYPFSPKGKIINSVISWKPIDRTAALVVSKCPWWALPPPNNETKTISVLERNTIRTQQPEKCTPVRSSKKNASSKKARKMEIKKETQQKLAASLPATTPPKDWLELLRLGAITPEDYLAYTEGKQSAIPVTSKLQPDDSSK